MRKNKADTTEYNLHYFRKYRQTKKYKDYQRRYWKKNKNVILANRKAKRKGLKMSVLHLESGTCLKVGDSIVGYDRVGKMVGKYRITKNKTYYADKTLYSVGNLLVELIEKSNNENTEKLP